MDHLLDFFTSQNNLLIIGVTVVSGALLLWPTLLQSRGGAGLSTGEAIQLVNRQQATWIDIRPAEQFQAGHIAQARNLPLPELDQKIASLPKNKPLVVVCESGRDGGRAVAKLQAAGLTQVHVLQGGMRAWAQASLPVVRKS